MESSRVAWKGSNLAVGCLERRWGPDETRRFPLLFCRHPPSAFLHKGPIPFILAAPTSR